MSLPSFIGDILVHTGYLLPARHGQVQTRRIIRQTPRAPYRRRTISMHSDDRRTRIGWGSGCFRLLPCPLRTGTGCLGGRTGSTASVAGSSRPQISSPPSSPPTTGKFRQIDGIKINKTCVKRHQLYRRIKVRDHSSGKPGIGHLIRTRPVLQRKVH